MMESLSNFASTLLAFALFTFTLHSTFTISLFDPYDDKLSFSISWVHPNDVSDLTSIQSPRYERLELRTARNEPYTCYIPLSPPSQGEDESQESKEESIYFSDTLEPLFQSEKCHYRIEGYWTYEICHGNYLRQYHKEDVKGQKTSVISSDYALGYFDLSAKHFNTLPLLKTSYTGSRLPYYGVDLKKGSACTLLGGKNREASVKYICNPYGEHNEFLHIEEISTCHYSVIFGTGYLCKLHAFKLDLMEAEKIHCVAGEDGSDTGEPNDVITLNEEINMIGITPWKETTPTQYVEAPPFKQTHSIPGESVVLKVLAGEVCLQGGSSGWWKYEFCYGDYVKQYHVDTSESQEILVGSWNKKAHIRWFETNKSEMRLVTENMVMHYYTGGDTCEDTGIERSVVVKMKCVRVGSFEQVSIYLEEPKLCEYELTVESEIFCELMESVGDYGVFQEKKTEDKQNKND